MPNLHNMFELETCPHCGVNRPALFMQTNFETKSHKGDKRRVWYIYTCAKCGGVISAAGNNPGQPAWEIYPSSKTVDDSLPLKAKAYLEQALNSLHAPSGAIMLAASCVDAMLKEKGYTDGSLYKRIDKAKDNHLITPDMAAWAHEVRLDANDERHADLQSLLPTETDAKRVVEFTSALAEILFILPTRIQRGINDARE